VSSVNEIVEVPEIIIIGPFATQQLCKKIISIWPHHENIKALAIFVVKNRVVCQCFFSRIMRGWQASWFERMTSNHPFAIVRKLLPPFKEQLWFLIIPIMGKDAQGQIRLLRSDPLIFGVPRVQETSGSIRLFLETNYHWAGLIPQEVTTKCFFMQSIGGTLSEAHTYCLDKRNSGTSKIVHSSQWCTNMPGIHIIAINLSGWINLEWATWQYAKLSLPSYCRWCWFLPAVHLRSARPLVNLSA
jgi:hypothetical protein